MELKVHEVEGRDAVAVDGVNVDNAPVEEGEVAADDVLLDEVDDVESNGEMEELLVEEVEDAETAADDSSSWLTEQRWFGWSGPPGRGMVLYFRRWGFRVGTKDLAVEETFPLGDDAVECSTTSLCVKEVDELLQGGCGISAVAGRVCALVEPD